MLNSPYKSSRPVWPIIPFPVINPSRYAFFVGAGSFAVAPKLKLRFQGLAHVCLQLDPSSLHSPLHNPSIPLATGRGACPSASISVKVWRVALA